MTHLRLLVIERDADRAAFWVSVLEKLTGKCVADVLTYAPQALRRLAGASYDLVLIGGVGPGSLATETLWEMRCRGYHLPVLVVSNPDEGDLNLRGLGIVESLPAVEGYHRFLGIVAANLLARRQLTLEVERLRDEVSRLQTECAFPEGGPAKDDLRGKLLDRVISSQEEERKSLAEDIHDESLQALATCLYKIDLIYRFSEMNESARALGELRDLRVNLAENIDRLRNLTFDLRPSTLDSLGLLPTLDALLQKFEVETGAQAILRSAIGRRLSPDLETLVYRLVQGALENVRKHARATAVFVNLKRVEDVLRVVVEDNGVGFSPAEAFAEALQSGRLGLAAMRERVELAGGHLEVDSGRGDGTRVVFVLPFRSVDAAAPEAMAGMKRDE